jgi:HicB family
VHPVAGEYTRNVVGVPSPTGDEADSGDQVGVRQRPKTGPQHSGRLLVRMPATLHDELARAAEAERVSLNQLITGILASAVDWRWDDAAGPTPNPVGRRASQAPEDGVSSRLTRLALATNLAVVLIAAIVAIILLVAAWRAGF